MLAGAGRTKGKDVVAVALDPDPELDRGDGPGLAQQTLQRLQVVGGLEGELPKITLAEELFGLQRLGIDTSSFPSP